MQFRKFFNRTIVFVLFSSLVGFTYIYLSSNWIVFARGLLTFNPKIFLVELPLFVLISVNFFFPSMSNWMLRNILPVVPGLILYFLFDSFYNFFGRVATPSDFQNFTDIFLFSTWLAFGLIAIYLLIPFSIYLSVKYNNFTQLKKSLTIRFISLILSVVIILSPITKSFQDKFFNYTVWAQEDTIRENGRFNSLIFYALQESSNAKLLEDYSDANKINIKETLYPNQIIYNQNVHIIAMESFIDPRLIDELNLPDSFISKQLVKYLNQQQDFSRVVSPIYGGGTAQTEFELLTGIKALSKVNQIEFNTMQGNKINAFINALSSNNYTAHAMIAPSSEFFNSKRAYKSLGFDNVIFLQESNVLESVSGSIFDSDLFDFNIDFLRKYIQNNDKPILNYVLGMYGHLPFKRNIELRPDVISPNHSDDRLNRISNQFYYRTEALADYLEKLIEIDPTSIIFVTSDHLPSVLSKNIHYQLNNKINIALFINNGKTIDVSGKNLYQIPWFIWQLLTSSHVDGIKPKAISPCKMEELYFTALSESLKN